MFKIRLESTASFWYLDRVSVDYGQHSAPRIQELFAEVAVTREGRDIRSIINGIDGQYYVMEPGDEAELIFEAPPTIADGSAARSYVLESTGWYRIHTPETGTPQHELLHRALTEPSAVARISTGMLQDAIRALDVPG